MNESPRIIPVPELPDVSSLPTEDFYYDKGRKEYLLKNKRRCWLSLTETQFKKELAIRGYCTRAGKNEDVSQADRFIIELRDTRDIDYIGPLAGYASGFYELNGHRILVTDSPQFIEPVADEWGVLQKFIFGLLSDKSFDQVSYLYGWIKTGYESLKSGQLRPGQALAIAGPHQCGKSLLQQLLTRIFGGRTAKPYAYMTAASPFNGDLFESEHLCIEDEPASTDLRTRRVFGSQIKQITGCDVQRCHSKHRPAISLSPFWRLSISLNDESENLSVLPPLDDSMMDKLIILRASKTEMPMPTQSYFERTAFWNRLTSELPAFLHYLTRWEIPANLRSERYGIAHFHHPELLTEIDALAPEFRLLTIIDQELFGEQFSMTWSGTAEELEKRITDEGSYQNEARRLLSWNNAAGTYLGRLAKKHPNRFEQDRSKQTRTWKIQPPKT